MSMDDLYNNLKVYEPEVKGMFSSSSSIQNMAFVSSSNNNTKSSIEAVNAAYGVTTASTQVNTAYSKNINNLSDAVIQKPQAREASKIQDNHKTQNTDNGRGEPPHNTKHLLANKKEDRMDKHGFPPTKRLFKVTELDPVGSRIHFITYIIHEIGTRNEKER
ncbi:hypothetical protein Tco_0349213 [Tanacetum coccineum]